MNAKLEIIESININKVICAHVHTSDYDYDERWRLDCVYNLKVWHSDEEYNKWLESLNFKYDSWYGWQELFWTVWLEWWKRLERWEYDWSERWELRSYPDIPEELGWKSENSLEK